MKPISGFPGYFVTKEGDVYGPRRKLKPLISEKGYLRVDLCRNKKAFHKRISRLVAQAFIPNPDNLPEVDHIDNDRMNNHVSNLEWVTRKENCERSQNRPVQALDYKVDVVILDFPSLTFADAQGFSSSCIWRCCNGQGKTYKSYRWRYKP